MPDSSQCIMSGTTQCSLVPLRRWQWSSEQVSVCQASSHKAAISSFVFHPSFVKKCAEIILSLQPPFTKPHIHWQLLLASAAVVKVWLSGSDYFPHSFSTCRVAFDFKEELSLLPFAFLNFFRLIWTPWLWSPIGLFQKVQYFSPFISEEARK